MKASALTFPVLLVLAATSAAGQSVLERSPNIQGVWGLDPGRVAFAVSHRFEVYSGGDQLASIPTLTLAVGLPLGSTAGIDYTSYSEVVEAKLLGNERQFWLKRPFGLGPVRAAGMIAHNSAAESADAALDLSLSARRFALFAEGRAFSDLFGTGDAGAAAAAGAALRFTEYLGLTGDYGKVLTEEDIPAAWSAALAMVIPASPHTFSLQVTNTGATTLQGASRKKTVGSSDVRYGFAFTVAFGGRGRWARIFSPVAPAGPPPATEAGVASAAIRDMSFAPAEVRIRPGESVEWVNLDPVAHTVTGTTGQWGSGSIGSNGRYRHTFTEAGTYPYYCEPHPGMTGRVVVEP